MNYLFYLVSCFGALLILFFVFAMSKGKNIDDNQEHILELGGNKFQTSGLTAILIVGAFLLILPLIINKDEDVSKKDSELISQIKELSDEKDILTKKNRELKNKIGTLQVKGKGDTAKEECDSFVGDYTFHRNARYVFTSDEFTKKYGIRATAIDGSWDKVHCVRGETPGTYYLVGTDTSHHAIEVRVDEGEYMRVAIGTAKYMSLIHINKDGSFGSRRIIKEIGELDTKYDHPDYVKQFKKEIDLYDEYRKYVHRDTSQRSPCIVAVGYDNADIVLAFACQNYTRTMLRKKVLHN